MKRLFKLLVAVVILIGVLVTAGYFFAKHQVKGAYIDTGGVPIHYTDEGSGTPVVLVHGFAANSDLNWRRPGMHKRLLKEGFRVITIDLRGHGMTGKPHDPELYGLHVAEDVIKVLDHLQIERAHLVGYSLGGFVALKCAILFPEKWITVAPMASGWEDPQNGNTFAALENAINDFEAGKPVGPLINYFSDAPDTKTSFLHTQWFKILTGYLNDRQALVAMIRGVRGLGITKEELASIEAPVCGIVGDKDPFLSKAKVLQGTVPHHTLIIIEGADHITTMTSQKTQDGLVNFLKEKS